MFDAFEICITGDRVIHDVARENDWRSASIDRLAPDGTVIRTEEAIMEVFACKNAKEAITTARDLALKLNADGAEVTRVVVKAPYRARYADDGVYLEATYPSREIGPHPTSRIGGTLWETIRAQDHGEFEDLIDKHPEAMVELCLLDTQRGHDSDWMKGYLPLQGRDCILKAS